jgi:serine/threonine protein kinase
MKYQPQKPLGQGSYGIVCSAVDKTKRRKVALKKVPKAFDDVVDAKRYVCVCVCGCVC